MRIQKLTSKESACLGRIRKIYLESIPASERKPDSWIPGMADRPDYTVLAADIDDEVVAFAILFTPPQQPMALLEYFAVDAKYRDRGIGSTVLSQLSQCIGLRCVLAEVESVCGNENNARRQQFYHRQNFKRVAGLKYLLPLEWPLPPMELFLSNAPNPLPRKMLIDWLKLIYQRVYRRADNDPRLLRMTSEISDPVALE